MDKEEIPDSDASRFALVLSTCPNQLIAESIAEALVNQQLAACVNIVPGVVSVYRWKGMVEKDQEILLIAKTRTDVFKAVEQTIKSKHPYELPEIISVTINNGLPGYLSWLDDSIFAPDE